MPSDTDHVLQAKSNLNFLEFFYKEFKFNDWSITVSFYTAIHIIESAIYKTKTMKFLGQPITLEDSDDFLNGLYRAKIKPPIGLSKSPHEYRKLIVRDNFNEVANSYQILYSQSLSSRYKYFQCSNKHLEKVIKPQLLVIVNWSNNKFTTDFKLNV